MVGGRKGVPDLLEQLLIDFSHSEPPGKLHLPGGSK